MSTHDPFSPAKRGAPLQVDRSREATLALELPEEPPGPLRRALLRLPIALVVLVALVAVVEIGAALLAPLYTPREAHWESAAAVVRAGFRPGDLIAFAPAWSDQAGRQYLGDLMPREMIGRADEQRYARVWVLAQRGASLPFESRTVEKSSHGPIDLRLVENAAYDPRPVRYDTTNHLTDARVTTLPPRAPDESPCLRDGPVFRCRSTTVERRTLEIDYVPRLGTLVPVESGRRTRLLFEQVPLGQALRVYAGLHDYYQRKKGDGPVEFAVFIDGNPVASELIRPADAFHSFTIDTREAKGSAHSLRFEIESATPEGRLLGFHAEVIGDPADANANLPVPAPAPTGAP